VLFIKQQHKLPGSVLRPDQKLGRLMLWN